MQPVDVTIWIPAVMRLREVHTKVQAGTYNTRLQPSLTRQEEVLARFQPIFSPMALSSLTAEDFKSFLPFRSNLHWSDLSRHEKEMCADMTALRGTLTVLADDNQPIEKRYDYALGNIKGMGRAVLTAILLVMFPQKYGVWNATVEDGLKSLSLLPQHRLDETPGQYYNRVNAILNRLGSAVDVDLWTLDVLWYYLTKG